MSLTLVHSPEQRSQLMQSSALPRFEVTQLTDHEVDLHLCFTSSSGVVEAYCSLWWRHVPAYGTHRVGVVGHYASASDEAAASLLDDASRWLREKGCTVAIGPMDGNTWRRYRFVVDLGVEPPFFLEPVNPPEWPLQFERAGFRPLANYFSALNSDLTHTDDRMPRVAERMTQLGVVMRPARQEELRQELARIHRLSKIAFARNFLYTELSESAFIVQYEKLIPHIRPELLLLAERGRELVGFLFAIPDLAEAAREAKMDTFLIKTFAVLPDPHLAGLGGLLAAEVQKEGRRMGFSRCIHALMFEGNVSRNVSRHYATTTIMRKYVLFSRDLS
jgi:GNAT superfamily N-acetyltransferase